jgi:biotin synthase
MSSHLNNSINTAINLDRAAILCWLLEDDPARLDILWKAADNIRKKYVGNDVHLRGLIEISNYCARHCAYCGINATNHKITRYRMNHDEILACVRQAVEFGYGTVVLQSGEDSGFTLKNIEELIHRIKGESGLAITLSFGERSLDELTAWRKAGADRYLMRFETSNQQLFNHIHPPKPGQPDGNRLELLRSIRELGYEVGSGVLIGIPGQSYDDLANDLELFRELDLDMIGVGPFIPHPDTPLGDNEKRQSLSISLPMLQSPNSELMTYKMIALSRLICPRSNIPSSTALATLNLAEGRELGLQRGANVLMPNITPLQYRIHYEIYPAKACIRETADECHHCMKLRITALGRSLGKGAGTSTNLLFRQSE